MNVQVSEPVPVESVALQFVLFVPFWSKPDPLSVAETAYSVYEEEKLDRFDRVFCVIDRDGQSTFKAAETRVKALQDRGCLSNS